MVCLDRLAHLICSFLMSSSTQSLNQSLHARDPFSSSLDSLCHVQSVFLCYNPTKHLHVLFVGLAYVNPRKLGVHSGDTTWAVVF